MCQHMCPLLVRRICYTLALLCLSLYRDYTSEWLFLQIPEERSRVERLTLGCLGFQDRRRTAPALRSNKSTIQSAVPFRTTRHLSPAKYHQIWPVHYHSTTDYCMACSERMPCIQLPWRSTRHIPTSLGKCVLYVSLLCLGAYGRRVLFDMTS